MVNYFTNKPSNYMSIYEMESLSILVLFIDQF